MLSFLAPHLPHLAPVSCNPCLLPAAAAAAAFAALAVASAALAAALAPAAVVPDRTNPCPWTDKPASGPNCEYAVKYEAQSKFMLTLAPGPITPQAGQIANML